MPEGDRYIDVPATKLLAELRAIGAAIKNKGGVASEGLTGQEVHFNFTPPNRQACVRVYTSLGVGRTKVRDLGRDAIRITVGAEHKGRFKLVIEKRRLYRTAPKGEPEERVAAFLERLKSAIREAYRAALHVPSCPACNRPMALRKNKKDSQKFYGCIDFPECKVTRSANRTTR